MVKLEKIMDVLFNPTEVGNPLWQKIDPKSDILYLKEVFDDWFFDGTLGGVELVWSGDMKRWAGCTTFVDETKDCCIKLSSRILEQLPRCETVNTLLVS